MLSRKKEIIKDTSVVNELLTSYLENEAYSDMPHRQLRLARGVVAAADDALRYVRQDPGLTREEID